MVVRVRISIIAIGLSLALGAAACAKPPAYPYAQEPDPRTQEYVLDVPDEVRINVWGHDELNTRASLRPDGTLTMPLVGDIPAAGKTPSQLKAIVSERLREFVKLPDNHSITVEVVTIGSYRITVSGEVERPSVLSPTHYLTVSEAITQVGGPTRFADSSSVEVVRTRPTGKVVRIPIRYDHLEKGESLEQDIVLLRGDLVYVP